VLGLRILLLQPFARAIETAGQEWMVRNNQHGKLDCANAKICKAIKGKGWIIGKKEDSRSAPGYPLQIPMDSYENPNQPA
jgi:hypothetical protein